MAPSIHRGSSVPVAEAMARSPAPSAWMSPAASGVAVSSWICTGNSVASAPGFSITKHWRDVQVGSHHVGEALGGASPACCNESEPSAAVMVSVFVPASHTAAPPNGTDEPESRSSMTIPLESAGTSANIREATNTPAMTGVTSPVKTNDATRARP